MSEREVFIQNLRDNEKSENVGNSGYMRNIVRDSESHTKLTNNMSLHSSRREVRKNENSKQIDVRLIQNKANNISRLCVCDGVTTYTQMDCTTMIIL